MVDSGTSCLVLPAEDFLQWKSNVDFETVCGADMSGAPRISIKIGDYNYVFSAADYCVHGFPCVQGQAEPFWILGDVFHRK